MFFKREEPNRFDYVSVTGDGLSGNGYAFCRGFLFEINDGEDYCYKVKFEDGSIYSFKKSSVKKSRN